MKTRTLGLRTLGQGLSVSAIGLGCMSLSGAYGEALSMEEATLTDWTLPFRPGLSTS